MFERLKKWLGSRYVKNQQTRDLTMHMQYIISNPQKLFNINFKKKNRLTYINSCFRIIRHMPTLSTNWMSKPKINGVQPFFMFDRFQLERSDERIKDFQCTSNQDLNLIVCHIGRYLHVYDYLTSVQILKLPLPEIRATQKGNGLSSSFINRSIYLMDKDQIIMVHDGSSKIIMIGLMQYKHLFKKMQVRFRTDEVKQLIDVPKPGNEVDIGFKRLPIEDDVGSEESEKDQQGEDHEFDNREHIKREFDIGYDIWSIAQSHIKNDFCYIGFIGSWRFTVYSMYMDLTSVCELNSRFDCNFHRKKELKAYGQPLCMDFEESALTFVTGSNIGWICTYDITCMNIIDALFVRNPRNPHQIESIDLIRDICQERYLVCYSMRTQHLMFIRKPRTRHECRPHPSEDDPVGWHTKLTNLPV